MRLIKVNAPQGKGADVAQIAFSVEIEKVSLYRTESLQSDGRIETKDTIDIETSTPTGKRFIDALLAADFFNRKDFTVAVRQPRTVISDSTFHELTRSFLEPPVRYNDLNTLAVSFLISLATGIAAGFSNIDDVGQLQFIGPAATAQIALIPVWFGICAVLGSPPADSQSEITSRTAAFFINVLTIIVTTFIIFTVTKAANSAVSNLKEG